MSLHQLPPLGVLGDGVGVVGVPAHPISDEVMEGALYELLPESGIENVVSGAETSKLPEFPPNNPPNQSNMPTLYSPLAPVLHYIPRTALILVWSKLCTHSHPTY